MESKVECIRNVNRLLKDIGSKPAIHDLFKGLCGLSVIDMFNVLDNSGQFLLHSVCEFGRATKVELT